MITDLMSFSFQSTKIFRYLYYLPFKKVSSYSTVLFVVCLFYSLRKLAGLYFSHNSRKRGDAFRVKCSLEIENFTVLKCFQSRVFVRTERNENEYYAYKD